MENLKSKSQLAEVLIYNKNSKGEAKFNLSWNHKGHIVPLAVEFKEGLCWGLLGGVPYAHGVTLMLGNYADNPKKKLKFVELTVMSRLEKYKIILEFTDTPPFKIIDRPNYTFYKSVHGERDNGLMLVVYGRMSKEQQKLVCVNLMYAALRHFTSASPFKKTLNYFKKHPKTRAHTKKELEDRYKKRRQIRLQSY